MDILDHLPEALFIVANFKAGDRILYANPRASQMFGYERRELRDCPVGLLIPDFPAGAHSVHRHDQAQSPRARAMDASPPLRARRRDGTEFPVSVQLNVIDDGPDPPAVAIVRDLTDDMRLQDALKQARDAAVRANDVKSRFVAAASHDLRQPLQTIWSLHSLLARDLRDTALAPYLALLEDSVRGMDQILSSLIDINRLERGAIQPAVRDFPLREILPRLRSEFGYSAAGKSLVLEIEDSPDSARSDPMLLLVILRNLLGNAIKYTRRGSVRLSVRTVDSTLCIDVADTGPGIPHEHLDRLFEAFYQIDNPSHDQRQGVGLGLSIVQTLCQLLGHTIAIESSVGEGSRFTVTLPRAAASVQPGAPAAARPVAARRASGHKVLHIEDDPSVAMSMAMLLRAEGYKVVSVGSRAEAIEQVGGCGLRPDLILCDYQLPGGFTGDEILAELGELLPARPPTVLLTGDVSDRRLDGARAMADRIMPKPVDVNMLLGEMAVLLGLND